MRLARALGVVEPAKSAARRVLLEAASLAAALGLSPAARGRGLIFTLHHVRPKTVSRLDPNAHLDITPRFLGLVITELAKRGYEFLPIEALPERLAGKNERPFAIFTLDDGYRDNVEHALPVFAAHGVPFTVFACTGFIGRTHSMWWETALALVAAQDEVVLDFGRGAERLPSRTLGEKKAAYAAIGRRIMTGDEAAAIGALDTAARAGGIDPMSFVEAMILDKAELQALSRHPLATIGAHSVSHRAMARLSPEALRQEIGASRQALETIIGRAPTVFAFPYGHHAQAGAREYRAVAEQGFAIAVTTIQAAVQTDDLSRLNQAPRINLDGRHQKRRYVAGLASGLAFRPRRTPDAPA